MMIVGSTKSVSHPIVTLTVGGQEIPATSFSSQFAAGQIAVARAGILPQYINSLPDAASNQKCEVRISDANGGGGGVLFSGYLSGISGMRSGRSFTAGVDMIHIARDLDNMRFGAPGLHPNGAQDFRYIKYSASASASSGYDKGMWTGGSSYYTGGNLVTPVLAEISRRLGAIGTMRTKSGLHYRYDSLAATQALLKTIIVKGGDLFPTYANIAKSDINRSFVQKIENSFNGQASLWDTVCSMFGEFGILLLCMPDGTVVATPDTSGLASNGSNMIGGDQILAFRQNSQFYRNVGGVDIINSQLAPKSPATAQLSANSLVASYYPSGSGSDGASFVLNAPRFLWRLGTYTSKDGAAAALVTPPSPGTCRTASTQAATGGSPTDIGPSFQPFRDAYAKMIYFIERDKMRTLSATTPLMPGAFPGTMVTIQPYSTAKIRPNDGQSISSKDSFQGYCFSVSHNIDFKAKSIGTTMQFRNVSSTSEPRSSDHPLYPGWKPLSW